MTAKNAMEIFTILDKSNCRKCGEKTCLAFAGAVFTGKKDISLCPTVSQHDLERFSSPRPSESTDFEDPDITAMKMGLGRLNFEDTALRTGGVIQDGWLSIKVMGKDFRVDRVGNFSSDIHINDWVAGPILTYILQGEGLEPVGQWISYREVKGGRERYNLFHERCEEDLRKVADLSPGLFRDLVTIFQGREVVTSFDADISVVLLPLPKVPVMICYWQPEEGIGSKLSFFFDETVNANIGNDGIYALCSGLVTMFEKISARHSRGG